jgi:hypothetical protein
MGTRQSTPDRIMQLGFGFWGSKTLLSAVELGLFTELAKRIARCQVALAKRLEAASAKREGLFRRIGRPRDAEAGGHALCEHL